MNGPRPLPRHPAAQENGPPFGRRSFLRATAAAGATGLVAVTTPSFLKPAYAVVRSGRPSVTHGVQSGDVTARSAVVWARADRPARMLVELAGTPSFSRTLSVQGPFTDESSDFTAQLRLEGLGGGRDVFYRVRFADHHDETLAGEPVVGHFRTAPTTRGDVSFVWSGDTAGQGWGIDPDRGGMRTYETMRQLSPDLFIHSGDTIYADGPLAEVVPLPDGSTWRNVVTPEKSKVAETPAEFRGNFRYNLLDENVRRFNAEVPVLAQWDDHETTNNWYRGEILDDPRYSCRRSRLTESATWSGSRPTSTTPPPTTTTRLGHCPATSIPSGSSSPARCTPARSALTPSTPPSGPKCDSSGPLTAPTSRRRTGCSSSAT